MPAILAEVTEHCGQRLNLKKAQRESDLKVTPVDHFAAEMDHFAECVLNGKNALTPGEEGLADMRAIAAIDEAVTSGRAVRIGR